MAETEPPDKGSTNEPSLNQRLEQIRSSPKLQSQKQSAAILSAVEETLREQNSEFTPTAYFAALLSLLNQYVSSQALSANAEVATAVVYLLDLVTPHVPQPLLRSKFTAILSSLAPALTQGDADAPFLRSAIGSLVSLLVAQNGQAWAIPQDQIGPRKALAGLLALAVEQRPKVRKRAQEGVATILRNPPPSPSIDHPAADMCAETALQNFGHLASLSIHGQGKTASGSAQHDPRVIHSMQLVRAIASATAGWPSRSMDSLCEVLFAVARARGEFLTKAAFDVFEAVFEGMARSQSFDKLPRLLEIVFELQPSQTDLAMLPPWIAIVSRGYDVSAQVNPDETFTNIPPPFQTVAEYLALSSYSVRVSASECLISLLVNCIPDRVILEPSIQDEKTLEKLASTITDLLGVKYQNSWQEVFNVVEAAFEVLKWRASPIMSRAVQFIGELRSNESFAAKDAADKVISKAISAAGPEAILKILPLNLISPSASAPGRAWMMPLLRDSVCNTNLAHFKDELVPLSEFFFQRVLEAQAANNVSMESKIADTLVQQIWSSLPGYCDRTLDVTTAFDQGFAEMISKLLYQKPDMRITLCKALHVLVDSFKVIAAIEGADDLILQWRISKVDAQRSLDHLAKFAPNLLAVLFNVYTETSPQHRGPILACIDTYLSISSAQELTSTFDRVTSMLQTSEDFSAKPDSKPKPKQQGKKPDEKPPLSHALMDIVVTMALYLPREGFQSLFTIASVIVSGSQDPQIQKKAYKLIPRLGQSDAGRAALRERNAELRQLLMNSAEALLVPARRDRFMALSEVVENLPSQEFYFIPSILPEVILGTKEANEKAREAAFDLLVKMGDRMQQGGTIENSKVSHMPDDAPPAAATLEEYFTMLSAGLAGSTPHMVSASVTAISRVLFHFHQSLSEPLLVDLLQTMDLFLKSPSREIVRSVLGFVKVCVTSLPAQLMLRRLSSLIPSLMVWSHEHKGHFKTKVKNILERMIRRFGFEVIERHCPDEDRKLITNIRKTRDRRKRKKTDAADDDDEGTSQTNRPSSRQKFENEFDEAVYGSSDSDASVLSEDEEQGSHMQARNRQQRKSGQQTYILDDDDDEPLDLLDRKALGKISSTRPGKPRERKKRSAEVDIDGKLVVRADGDELEDGDDMDLDDANTTLEQGIGAYVDAIRSRDAPQRGQKGKLKFSNRKTRGPDDMEEDVPVRAPAPRGRGFGPRGMRGMRGARDTPGMRGRGGRGGPRGYVQRGPGPREQRRGLGVEKQRDGRVAKTPGKRGVARGRARGLARGLARLNMG